MSFESERQQRADARKRRARQGKPVRAKHANPTVAKKEANGTVWRPGLDVANRQRAAFYEHEGMSPEEMARENYERRKARARCRSAWEREAKASAARLELEKELTAAAEEALAELEELVDVGVMIAGAAAGTLPLTRVQLDAAKSLQRGTVKALREILDKADTARVTLTSMYGGEED